MTDPFSLVPLAIAARGGRVDGYEAAQLVAAGVTLLQRSAPLVRALAMGRSAILLPPSPAVLVALAASDGRGALMLDPDTPLSLLRARLARGNARAVFTTSAQAPRLGHALVVVLLDEAPRRATVVALGVASVIDLGSHFGLTLEGDQNAAGSDEECVLFFADDSARADAVSHRQLLSAARALAPAHVASAEGTSRQLTDSLASLDGLLALLYPLLAGQSVHSEHE